MADSGLVVLNFLCSEEIWRGSMRGRCSRNGYIKHEGKYYCKQHSPEAKKDRQDKRNALHRAKLEETDRRLNAQYEMQRKVDAFPAIVAALKIAESTFSDYARHHYAKPDIEKGQKNQWLSDQMSAAIKLAEGE